MAERALVLDACLAITFGEQERLGLITHSSRQIVIGARAREEVERPPARTELEEALRDGDVEVGSIDLDDPDDQDVLARYDAMPALRDRGDARGRAARLGRRLSQSTRSCRRSPGMKRQP